MKQRKRPLKTSMSGTGDSKALAHCQSAFCLVRRWATSLKSKLGSLKKKKQKKTNWANSAQQNTEHEFW